MEGLAAHHTAERNRGIVRLAAFLGGIESNSDRRWNFERAGNCDNLMRHAGGIQVRHRALQQRVLNIVVKARLDDQRAGAAHVGLVFQRGASRVGHGSIQFSRKHIKSMLTYISAGL